MKIFVHTLNTWLVANLIHPVVFIIYFLWLNDAEGNNWGAGFFLIGVFSFFASIPSLLLSWFLQYAITNTNFSLTEKFISWILSVVVAIFLNFAGLKLLYDVDVWTDIDEIMPPPVIAAILSILIRYRQFFALQANHRSIENENNITEKTSNS